MTHVSDCPQCTTTTTLLTPGASAQCTACGATIRDARRTRERSEPTQADHDAQALDELMRDAPTLAVWLARTRPRAVDLDPEARMRAGEPTTESTVRSEARGHVGHALERVLIALERADADTARVDPEHATHHADTVRWLAERGGEARVSVVQTGARMWSVSLGDAFAADMGGASRQAAWSVKGKTPHGTAVLARAWGELRLLKAARAWVSAKRAMREAA